MENDKHFLGQNGVSYVIPFILITLCFALWGFATNITSPIVSAFTKIFRLDQTYGYWIKIAFYTGYLAMALPAAILIERRSFKSGVLVGLGLYILGTFLFFPSKISGSYYPFLLSYFVMTCGMSFLQTSCNTYIYVMGSRPTAVQRLNLAQAFNPIGSMLGMFIALNYISNRISPLDLAARRMMSDSQFEMVKNSDLSAVIRPYLIMGIAIIIFLAIIYFVKMPKNIDTHTSASMGNNFKQLFGNANYREGVIAEFFYEGAEIMCWTFIVQYAVDILTAEGMNSNWANTVAQKYNIIAMAFFCASRFIFTWLMKFMRPAKLMLIASAVAIVCLIGVIAFHDRNGIYFLVLVSACLSLMFPTIYGTSLYEVGDNIKFGGAGLIMAIFGSVLLPPIQGVIAHIDGKILGLPAINVSFIIPILCLVVVAIYSWRAHKRFKDIAN